MKTYGEWIPVEETLPEEHMVRVSMPIAAINASDNVLVTVEDDNGNRSVGITHMAGGRWLIGFPSRYGVRVVAWMDLPEPYMEDKQ